MDTEFEKIYLSGPMTGMKDFNRPAFHQAARRLRKQGYLVFNPAELPGSDEHTSRWPELMRLCIRALPEYDALAALNGWEYSTGAGVEVLVAEILEIPVLDAYGLQPLHTQRIQKVISQLALGNQDATQTDPGERLLTRYQNLFMQHLQRTPMVRPATDAPKMRDVVRAIGPNRAADLLEYFFTTWLNIKPFAAQNPCVSMFVSQIEPMEQHRRGQAADPDMPWYQVMQQRGWQPVKTRGIVARGYYCQRDPEHETLLYEKDGKRVWSCSTCREMFASPEGEKNNH